MWNTRSPNQNPGLLVQWPLSSVHRNPHHSDCKSYEPVEVEGMSLGSGRSGALGFLFGQWGSGFSPRARLLQVACRHSLRLGWGLITGLWIIATFRLQYEDDYKYKFSVLSTRFRFGGRKFSKCACSELKTRSCSRPHTPIWGSLLLATGGGSIQQGLGCGPIAGLFGAPDFHLHRMLSNVVTCNLT